MKKRIAVITGGEASEREISLKSADVVCRHLNKKKCEAYKIVIEGDEWVYSSDEKSRKRENAKTRKRENSKRAVIDKNDFSLTIEKKKIKFDCVFLAIHGTPAEDGKLQG